MAALGGLLVLAGVAVWAMLTLGPSDGERAARQPSPHSVSTGAAPAEERLTWLDYQGVELPVSQQAGPRSVERGRAEGFDRSDLGAALAATHLVVRAGPGPGPGVFEPTIAQQVTGPDAGRLAQTVSRDYQAARLESGINDGDPLGVGNAEVLGYRVVKLSDAVRHVTLVEEAPDGNGVPQHFEIDVAVQWVDGDWRLVAPRDGDWTTAFTQLDQPPADYTSFDRTG